MAAPSSTVGSDWRAGLPLSPPLWLVAWPGSHTYTHTYTHPEPITVAGLGHTRMRTHTALPLSPTAVADGLAWITHTCACPHAHTLNQSPWPKAQGYELEAGLMTGPPPLSLGLQVCGPRCVLHLQPTVMALIVWLGAHAHPKAIPWWRERSRSMSVSTLVPEDRAARPPHKAWEWGGAPPTRDPEERRQPPALSFVAQPTWRPCCPTSPAVSLSTPSSTWVPSGSSRCSSQTRPSCRTSCSSASSQVRG